LFKISDVLQSKRSELEENALEYRKFQEDLNKMFNWINSIHLDFGLNKSPPKDQNQDEAVSSSNVRLLLF
jgi:hypothetical protein